MIPPVPAPEPEWIQALRAWLRDVSIEALTAAHALPSPCSRAVSDVTTNAVFIDLVGRRREINLRPLLPIVRFPMYQPVKMTFVSRPIDVTPFPVASFRISSVIDGIAVYRQEPL